MYEIMFYVGLVLALFFLIISIILFVRNHVAKLIGDVTGWNAKKAIRAMNEKNSVNARSELTGPLEVKEVATEVGMTAEGNDEETALLAGEETALLTEEEETTLLAGEETTLLTEEEETTLLAGEETTLLMEEEETTLLAGEETTLLSADEETALLTGEETALLAADAGQRRPKADSLTELLAEETTCVTDIFQVEEDITITHTKESIGE